MATDAKASHFNSSQNASAPGGSASTRSAAGAFADVTSTPIAGGIVVAPSQIEEEAYRIAYCTRRTDFSTITETIARDGTTSFSDSKWCWQ